MDVYLCGLIPSMKILCFDNNFIFNESKKIRIELEYLKISEIILNLRERKQR